MKRWSNIIQEYVYIHHIRDESTMAVSAGFILFFFFFFFLHEKCRVSAYQVRLPATKKKKKPI